MSTTDMPFREEHCDVLVVGGGPAGSAAALTLRRSGLQVTLLEASDYERWRAGETLLPRVRQPLARLGANDLLTQLGSLPSYGNRSAWGGDELISHSFFGQVGAHGFHVDRRRFDAALADCCHAAGVEVHRQMRLQSVSVSPTGSYEVQAGGRRIIAHALIDASGRSASAAMRLGGRRERLDKLIAVVAQFPVAAPHGYTLIEAASDGWWYSAPVPGQRLIVAHLTDADSSAAGSFSDRLHATRHTRQRIENPGALAIQRVAACSQRLRIPPGPRRWLAVGDAAFSTDPLSGTGVQRALESGTAGAIALLQHLTGNAHALNRFEAALDSQYARYLQQRENFYAAETRFIDQPFWRRRARAAAA